MKSILNVHKVLLGSIVFLAMLGLSVTLFFTSISPVLAQELLSDCIGLDLVILIDQSGSMDGNDPNFFRVKAVQTAIEVIGDNSLIFCPDAVHRLAVVGFGDLNGDDYDTEDFLEPTMIDISFDQFDEWRSRKESIKDLLTKKSEDFLANTNHEAALNRAYDIFSKWDGETLEVEGLDRKKMVLLITDGGPCIKEGEHIVKGCASFSKAMEDIIVITDGPKFPFRGEDNEESVYIWVIGLWDSGGIDYLGVEKDGEKIVVRNEHGTGDEWINITQRHGGELVPLFSDGASNLSALNAEVNTRVADILNRFLGSQLEEKPCNIPIWVDPYQNNITIFHIFRKGALPEYQLEDLYANIIATRNGETVAEIVQGISTVGDVDIIDYTADGPNERYFLRFPPPGKYEIKVEGADLCKHIDIRFGQNGVDGNIISPTGVEELIEVDNEPFDTNLTFKVQLHQYDSQSGRTPLVENPEFPLKWSLDVYKIDVNRDENDEHMYHYEMRPLEGSEGIYESYDPVTSSTGYIKGKEPGRYRWEVMATVDSPRENGPKTLTIYQDSAEFVIQPLVRDFGFEIISPQPNFEYGLLDGVTEKDFEIVINLIRLGYSFSDELIDLFIQNPNKAVFDVQLLDEKGDVILDTNEIKLARNGTEFAGVIVEQGSQFKAGTYQVNVTLRSDNYNGNLFVPDTTTRAIYVQYVLTEQFGWTIIEPEADPEGRNPYPLHPILGWFPNPEDLPMRIELSRLNGDQLSPKDVLLDTGNALFSGELLEPGVADPHAVFFTWDKDTDSLIGIWPNEADSEGFYEIRNVSVIDDTYRASWQPVEAQNESIRFLRQNNLLSKPWMLPISSFALLFIVYIGIVTYNIASRPLGIISFIDPSTGLILHEEIMGRPIKGLLKTYRSTHDGLASLELGKLVVRKQPKDIDTGMRTVEIELFDSDGEFLVSQNLVTGQIFNHFYTYEREGEEKQAMIDVKYE